VHTILELLETWDVGPLPVARSVGSLFRPIPPRRKEPYLLQDASCVDQHLTVVIERDIGIVARLDLHRPLPFVVVPPGANDAMVEFDKRVEIVKGDDVLEVTQDLLGTRVAVLF
jgi:hypothetical protein